MKDPYGHKYSRFKLKPHDEHKKALFWDFRCEDIATTLEYMVMFNTYYWIVTIVQYMIDPSKVTFTNLCFTKA